MYSYHKYKFRCKTEYTLHRWGFENFLGNNNNNNNNNNVHTFCAISLYKIEHTAHYKHIYIRTINPENPIAGGRGQNWTPSLCGDGPKLPSRRLRNAQWVVGHIQLPHTRRWRIQRYHAYFHIRDIIFLSFFSPVFFLSLRLFVSQKWLSPRVWIVHGSRTRNLTVRFT